MASASNLAAPTVGVVMASPDGLTWTKKAELTSRFSVEANSVFLVGNRVVVVGSEDICATAQEVLTGFSGGNQRRLWVSDDGGTTFTEGDSSAGGIIEAPNPAPTDSSACPSDDPNRLHELYSSWARLVGVTGDKIVVWSVDGTRVAVSSDALHWTVANLPGSTPSGGMAGYPASPPLAAAVTMDGSRIVLLSDEAARDAKGLQLPYDDRVLGWTTTDGRQWTPLPLAQTVVAGTSDSLTVLPDGSVMLTRAGLGVLRSVAGTLR
jgi:hypothetical protein